MNLTEGMAQIILSFRRLFSIKHRTVLPSVYFSLQTIDQGTLFKQEN